MDEEVKKEKVEKKEEEQPKSTSINSIKLKIKGILKELKQTPTNKKELRAKLKLAKREFYKLIKKK